ncbi:putative ribonuclease H-like domain-containing protein [Tanacetum coccineum]
MFGSSPLTGTSWPLPHKPDIDDHDFSTYGSKSNNYSGSNSVSNDFVSCDTSDKSSDLETTSFASCASSVHSSSTMTNASSSVDLKTLHKTDDQGPCNGLKDYSVARTPQQNGVAEKKNRTLIEAARTMLVDSKLPTMFWTEAKVPNISHLKPFGCHVTILNTSDHLGKFEDKADEGLLVGYSAHSKAYRVYNLSNKKIEETLNLRYMEDKPNVQVPLRFITASANMESTSAYAEELARLQGQAYAANAAAKDTWKTADTVPAVSGVPATSIPAGIIKFQDCCGIGCLLTYPSSSVVEPCSFCADDHATSSFTHWLKRKIYTIFLILLTLCKSHILNFRDEGYSHHHPTTGIFSESTYDADFGDLFTNLAPTITVDPVSTRRVHNVHPISQIIGDITSPVLTRGTLKKSKFGESALAGYVHDQQQGQSHRPISHFCHEARGEGIDYDGECLSLMGKLTNKSMVTQPKGQDKYVQDILAKYDMESVRPATTPYEAGYAKFQVVATSSTEAEYVAAAHCCGQSTICIVKNPVFHQRTKHIEIRHHFIRDANEKNLIQVLKIHTDDNVADLLTKAFDGPDSLLETNFFHGDHMPLVAAMVPPPQAAIVAGTSREAAQTNPQPAHEPVTAPMHPTTSSHDHGSTSPRPTPTTPAAKTECSQLQYHTPTNQTSTSAPMDQQGPSSDPHVKSSSKENDSNPVPSYEPLEAVLIHWNLASKLTSYVKGFVVEIGKGKRIDQFCQVQGEADVNEDNFAARMAAVIAERRRKFAAHRFQDKINKPMTFVQQKQFNATFVKKSEFCHLFHIMDFEVCEDITDDHSKLRFDKIRNVVAGSSSTEI